MPLPYEAAAGGVLLRVRVTPRAGRAEAGGLQHDAEGRAALKVKVTAPADKGRANEATIEVLARALHLAKSRLTLKSGEKDRSKLILIEGDRGEIERALQQLLAGFQEASP